jgi:ABC-type lipoprotein release transport system permease subunit
VIVFGVMLVAALVAALLLTGRSRDRLRGIAGLRTLGARVERDPGSVVDGQHQVHRP